VIRDLRRLSKAHLHVHLESTVRWSTLLDLGYPPELATNDTFGGFAAFFERNDLVRACLRRASDFRRIAVEYCEDEAADGVRYAEVSFTAAGHGERLGDLRMPLAAVLDGLAEGRERFGIEVGVLVDHSRRRSVDRAWRTLELARAFADRGVTAIGLAGDEAHPGEPFEKVFAAAREAGIHVVHHAGEGEGPASIRQAVYGGRAERIGHGIRILEDPALVDAVRERGIALEVCPSSNVALGFARSLAEHPFQRLRAAGLAVTINTDIPRLIGVTLSEEYRRVRETFGYSDAEMAALATASVGASFAPAPVKDRLRSEIATWLAAPNG
jgi:adenosine deaminase